MAHVPRVRMGGVVPVSARMIEHGGAQTTGERPVEHGTVPINGERGVAHGRALKKDESGRTGPTCRLRARSHRFDTTRNGGAVAAEPIERTELEQLWANYRKALVAQIRLKHSIRADNEINRRLPAAKRAFNAAVQRGVFPTPPDFAAALDE